MPPPAAVPEAAEEKPVAPVVPQLDSTAALKKATANLKAVTGVIPHEVILKKTGTIAEGLLTPQQAQASKTKTSRIALDSAIGVAPVNSNAPVKTIRLKRPAGLSPSPAAAAPAAADAPKAEADPSVTQKKTLKLQRPGAAIKRPALGVAKKPLGIGKPPAAAPQGDAGVSNLEPIGDIPDIPDLKPIGGARPAPAQSEGPKWLTTLSIIVSIAALLVLGFTTWMLKSEIAGTDEDPNRFGLTAEREGMRGNLPAPVEPAREQ